VEAAFSRHHRPMGKVDRAKLSAKVVHDPAAIKRLEQIVHPMLGASRQKFLADASDPAPPFVVMDIPYCSRTGRAREAWSMPWLLSRPPRKISAKRISDARHHDA